MSHRRPVKALSLTGIFVLAIVAAGVLVGSVGGGATSRSQDLDEGARADARLAQLRDEAVARSATARDEALATFVEEHQARVMADYVAAVTAAEAEAEAAAAKQSAAAAAEELEGSPSGGDAVRDL